MMYTERQPSPEPFIDVDIRFLNEKLTLHVEPRRLKIGKGDIARALDPESCSLERCRTPVMIGNEPFVVIGGMRLDDRAVYSCMHGYHLIPIMDYPGPIADYRHMTRGQPRRARRCYTGLIVRLPNNEAYILGEEVDILPADELL